MKAPGYQAVSVLKWLSMRVGIRLAPGKQAEGAHGLENGHAATIERAAAALSGLRQERGFQGKVDDVGDPVARFQHLGGKRHAGIFRHARRRRMDQAVGRFHR